MPYHSYLILDPEDQASSPSDGPYRYYLQLWNPTGREHYALHDYDIQDKVFTGMDKEGRIVVSFPADFAWTVIRRCLLEIKTEEEMFEARLEHAQEHKMREDRAQTILKPKENNDGTYR